MQTINGQWISTVGPTLRLEYRKRKLTALLLGISVGMFLEAFIVNLIVN